MARTSPIKLMDGRAMDQNRTSSQRRGNEKSESAFAMIYDHHECIMSFECKDRKNLGNVLRSILSF